MKRVQVTWVRNQTGLTPPRITHPWVWEVVGTDGETRYFDTKAEAREHWATPAEA